MNDCVVAGTIVFLGVFAGWLIKKDVDLLEENQKLLTALKLANKNTEHMLKTWEPKSRDF